MAKELKAVVVFHLTQCLAQWANKDLSSFGLLPPLPRVSVSGNFGGKAVAFERVACGGTRTGDGHSVREAVLFSVLSYRQDHAADILASWDKGIDSWLKRLVPTLESNKPLS